MPTLRPSSAQRRTISRAAFLIWGVLFIAIGAALLTAVLAIGGGSAWEAILLRIGMPLSLLMGLLGLTAVVIGALMETRVFRRKP